MKLTTENTEDTEMKWRNALVTLPDDGETVIIHTKDVSLRDLFAGQALTGLMMSQWGKNSYVEFAKKSYAAADAMLFERSNYLKEAK